nr:zinc finger, CCHC-type [Tanacetum cinerariifolium]
MIEPNEKTQADKKDKTAIAFLYPALPEEQLLQITKHKTAKAIWDALKTRHIGEERVQQARLQTLKSDFEMLHMKEDETIDTFTRKLTTIVNKAAKEQLLQITKHKTAKATWVALKTRHIGEERVQQARLQTLKSDFEMLHIKEDETIDTFTEKLTTLVNKAASLGHTMEDETLVRKLLNVVPDRYLQIVASIEQYSDLIEMTLEEAIGRLKIYEERIKYKKGKQVDNQEKLMFTRHENKGKYFRGCRHGKHRFSQGRNHENFKEEKKDEENSHKNFNKNNFKKSNYDTSKLQCYKCKKIGHIAPKCPQRTKSNEQSNLVKEDLEPTLLMAILEDEEQKVSLHEEDVGYKETNKDSLWYLDNGASNHMTGVREHFKELNEKVSGKVRFRDGSYIEIKGKGLILIECDDEKQRIISHVYYIPILKSNLLSLGQFTEIGCKVVMEDDELRLYDMDNKIFMKVRRQRNRLYKENLRIGGEITSNEFMQYCKENGIARQLTAPYSPQQNGVVERRNRTIMSTTRCMIKATNMPQNFWAEAVRHAIYILNSVPTKALEDITSYEAIKQRKPNLKNLRVFGCITYAKVPSQHLTKLDDRSSRMVYLGNEQGSKTYRLFDPTTQRICVSRDVNFKENETWDWKEYMSEHINDEPEWTDFKIGNLEVTNEHHDQGIQPIEEDKEFPNNDDNDYASPTRDSPTHSQTPHIPPVIGFRSLNDLYENTEELLLAEDEPKNYKEASSDQKWIEAMKVELDSINRNNTWELATLPKEHKAIGLKWVFKTKKDANENIIKHKARLVEKGYIQEHGIDFEEVFAPVARMETIRLLLAIAANNKWEVHHLDVKSAFLHGDLKEEVYVTQPEGFVKKQDQGKVYRLIKALYGLRQSPCA